MAVLLIPPYLQFYDANGDPLSGGKVYTYVAGSVSTPKATFTDHTEATQAANPVQLDSAGRVTMWGAGSYKFAVYDANDNLIRTTDNVTTYTTADAEGDSFFQAFSGTGSQTAFTLSESLGTDENAIMVFVADGLEQHVTNGSFATDTAWTKGAGWTIGAGVATATGAISTALSQTSAVTVLAGQSYNLIYTVTRSAGGIIPSIGGVNGTERTASGTYRETIIAGSTQTLAFTGNAFTGTLDDISITPADAKGYDIQSPTSYTLSGTTLTFSSAPPSGTGNIYVFAPSLLVASANAAAAAADASAVAASSSAAAAAASAVNSENFYDQIIASSFVLYGTSTTSLSIGTGSKVFTTQAGKQWVLGQRLRAASDDGTKVMEGDVTDYTTDQLTLNVDYTEGAGTHADWNIAVTGERGAAGATGAAGPSNYTAPTTTVGANIVLEEGTNNGTNEVTLKAPDSLAADVTVIAPSVAGTLLTDADVKFKFGSFSYNVATASGSQAITGVGFQPDFVEFFGAIGGGSNEMMGHSDGTTEGTMYTQGGGSTTKQVDATKAMVFLTSATDAAQGDVAMTSDGFTITWTKVNSPTGTATIFYRAFKF